MSRIPFPHALAQPDDVCVSQASDAWFELGGLWSPDDVNKPLSGLRSRLFGYLLRHAAYVAAKAEPRYVVGHYPGDLYYDALTLRDLSIEDLIKGFRFQADGWGTYLHPLSGPQGGDRRWSWVFHVYCHAPYAHSADAQWFLHVVCEKAPAPNTLPGWMEVSI